MGKFFSTKLRMAPLFDRFCSSRKSIGAWLCLVSLCAGANQGGGGGFSPIKDDSFQAFYCSEQEFSEDILYFSKTTLILLISEFLLYRYMAYFGLLW